MNHLKMCVQPDVPDATGTWFLIVDEDIFLNNASLKEELKK